MTRYFDVKIRMLGFWPMPKFSCAHDVWCETLCQNKYRVPRYLHSFRWSTIFSPVEVPILGTLQRKNGYADPWVSREMINGWFSISMSMIDVSLLYLWGVSFVFVTLLVYLHRCYGGIDVVDFPYWLYNHSILDFTIKPWHVHSVIWLARPVRQEQVQP